MAIADDFSIAVNGDIRYTGSGANHTVLAFHVWIGTLLDDAQAAGDDLADITTDTISDRSTDNILELNAPFNIDDTAARHLHDGSITQAGGDTVYSGLKVLGVVVGGTEVMIVQDDKVLPAYWGTGINVDAPNNVIMSLMIKSREGGADIDGKRILTFGRELGDTFAEFPVTLGLGNSVSAISSLADLNNIKTRTTLEGYTSIGVIEGLRLLDIDNDTVDEEYYQEWDKGTQSLNDTFEVSKWWSARSLITLSGADTGTNYVIDDATIVGQAQSFTARGQDEKLTEARFNIKIGALAPTGPLTAELYASTAGIIPTGAVLATSEEVLSSLITSAYTEIIFRFNDNVTLTASTQYCIVVRHPDGTATDYFHVEGAAVGSVGSENAAEENPAATWTAAAGADLFFTVKSSPLLHGRAGELHRGVTHQVVYDGESGGPFTQAATLFWGTRITYDGESGAFAPGRYVEIQPSGGGTIKNGGKILFDDTTGKVLYVALENIAPTVALADNDIITQIGGTAASANSTATILDDDKDGGEGILLALDDDGVIGNVYLQVISGKAPVDELRINETEAKFAVVNVTVTGRALSQPFIGSTTGTNLIGAYGIGFETTDVGAADKFFDLSNQQNIPPNNVTFKVTGIVSGEDRVLVGPRTGTALNKAQFTTDVALTTGAEVSISIATVAIPTDTPATGTGADTTRLRVQLDSLTTQARLATSRSHRPTTAARYRRLRATRSSLHTLTCWQAASKKSTRPSTTPIVTCSCACAMAARLRSKPSKVLRRNS